MRAKHDYGMIGGLVEHEHTLFDFGVHFRCYFFSTTFSLLLFLCYFFSATFEAAPEVTSSFRLFRFDYEVPLYED